jgi:hypothetical protein
MWRNDMKTCLFRAVFLLSILAFAERCVHAGSGAKPPEPASLAEVCAAGDRYDGRLVTLEGVFQGFRIGECSFCDAASRRATTRSDWLFRSGAECFYVTGGIPDGIDRIDPEHGGRRLELKAKVTRNDEGKLHLTYVGGRVLPQ